MAGPWQALDSKEIETLARYLWKNKSLDQPYFPSVKEVDYYFRETPKSQWISEKALSLFYEKAQKVVKLSLKESMEADFQKLSLPQKINFLRYLLTEASLDEKKLYMLGKDYLILDSSLKGLTLEDFKAISPLFLQFELKFHEVKHA